MSVKVSGTQAPRNDPPAAADLRSAEQVAREFEAMLLTQMVQQMREALLEEEGEDGEGESLGLGRTTMFETIDVELARQLSKAGGIGLARVVQRSMTHATEPGMATPAQPAPAGTESPSGPVVIPTGGAGTAAETSLHLPDIGRLSSDFGWRQDPFHGRQRFHAGVDLKAAYGQAVPAAGAGRVTFAGEQGAYGLTVLVEHPSGHQTRYAHLSSVSVRAGEEVATGTLVGRVGQSGRATGPHLHFEVLVNGQAVDPAQVARFPGPLKNLGEVVD
jgi:murein DD-endopeptidase MepM/ murein hydrolase activator NlpD